MMTGTSPVTLQAVGDSALLVGFDNEISQSIHDQVLTLAQSLDEDRSEGVREIVSGYRTVLVHYDPLTVDFETLSEAVKSRIGRETRLRPTGRHWQIPALYGGEAAYDLDRIAREKDLTTEDVINIHRGTVYRVYMVGFAPGWTFLGGLDPRLFTPRLETPRMEVPPGCISIGGQQTLVAGPSMPSGWNLIGQTPERLFAPEHEDAFLLAAGDRVSFRAIGLEEFDRLSDLAEEGTHVSKELPWS
jgi:KipI family sensor histidine kinase inhibitor